MKNNRWDLGEIIPSLSLPRSRVHIWQASLDATVSQLECLYGSLSTDEALRAERFVFEKDRNDYTVGRGLLRVILSCYLDIDPKEIVFTYNEYGKPYVPETCGSEELRFNVAHSGRKVIYAVTCDREIGVDIEHIRPMTSAEGIIERYCSDREKFDFRCVPQSLKLVAFFNCWTRKEAYIKAQGEGLSRPLDEFSVSLAPGDPAAFLSSREATSWSLNEVEADDGYIAAVVVEGSELPLSKHSWSWQF